MGKQRLVSPTDDWLANPGMLDQPIDTTAFSQQPRKRRDQIHRNTAARVVGLASKIHSKSCWGCRRGFRFF
ncbi:hypothetical protein SUGI_0897040 [Cryptomeria japonica]|nr:hypothetical protein SUGI_0897040 [Cryptomeria japonica]